MIGIVVVNYKDYAKKYLAEFRETLLAQEFSSEQVKYFCIDNASTPETIDYLKSNFPVAMIIPREDGNYSAANNAGIREAMKQNCDYFVIVNMDVSLDKNWLKELFSAIRSDDQIGLVQSKVYLYPKNDIEKANPLINNLGNAWHFLGHGFSIGSGQADTDKSQDLRPIKGYISGCSFIIKKEMVEKIGFYDEEYYMYLDDLEISWRAKIAGYKLMLAPRSIIFHKYEFNRSIKMVYYMERNRYISVFTLLEWPTIVLIFPALVIMEFGILFFSMINGWFRQKMQVYKYFLSYHSWQKIFIARKGIKKIRKLKDCDLKNDIYSKIDFQEIRNPLLLYIGNPFLRAYWFIAKKIIFW